MDWNGAKYFGSPNAEHVSCDCPEDAVFEAFDGFLSPKMTDGEVAKLADEMEIDVAGYRPQEVGQGSISYAAACAADAIEETLTDAYGGPDSEPVLGADGELELSKSITAEVTRLLRERDVWSCDIVAQHTYTGNEILTACGFDSQQKKVASDE